MMFPFKTSIHSDFSMEIHTSDGPDANHGAGIFTYKTGWFWGEMLGFIFQHHGAYGMVNSSEVHHFSQQNPPFSRLKRGTRSQHQHLGAPGHDTGFQHVFCQNLGADEDIPVFCKRRYDKRGVYVCVYIYIDYVYNIYIYICISSTYIYIYISCHIISHHITSYHITLYTSMYIYIYMHVCILCICIFIYPMLHGELVYWIWCVRI